MKRMSLFICVCSFAFVLCASTGATADSMLLSFNKQATCTPFVHPSPTTCTLSTIPTLGVVVLQDGIVNQFYGEDNGLRALLGVQYSISTTVPMFNWALSVDTITHLGNYAIVDNVSHAACCLGDQVLGLEYFQNDVAYPLGLFNGHIGSIPVGYWQSSAQFDVFAGSGYLTGPLTLANVLAPHPPGFFEPTSTTTYSGDPLIQVPFAATADDISCCGGAAPREVFYGATPVPGFLPAASVQQPINPDGSSVFSASRGVVPVKFTLMQNGAPSCTLPPASIRVIRFAGGASESVDEGTYAMAADTGSRFRIDQTACQYVYNVAASSLGVGTYWVDISINGISAGHAVFALQ